MQNKLQLYYSVRVKHLFNHLHEFELKGDEGTLHDLRVELKKLHALIKFLLSIYSKQSLKRASNSLKTVFHECGEIREQQLMHQWLSKNQYHNLEKLYFPIKQLEKATKHFQSKTLENSLVIKDAINDVYKYVEATNQILAQHYVVDLHSHIEKLFEHQEGKDDWHEIRKYIKQWMYAINWLSTNISVVNTEYSVLNKLQEVIGIWHDYEVIKESLFRKQIHLSKDIEIQKEFTIATSKLDRSIRFRERQIVKMLTHTLVA